MDRAEGALLVAEKALEVARQLAAEIESLRAGMDKTINERVRAEVAVVVAALPKPKDGADGRDGKDGADGKDASVEDVAPVVERTVIKALADLPKPRDGRDGRDGESISLETIATLIASEVSKAVQAMPRPADGRDGRDGKDADPAHVANLVRSAVEAIPRPKDGVDGRSVTPEEVSQLVAKAVEAIPRPKDGADGRDGRDGVSLNMEDVVAEAVKRIPAPKDGRDGRDGIDGEGVTLDGVRPILEAECARWALDFERRAADLVQRAVDQLPRPKDGRDGADGRDGQDGFSPDDLEVSLDGRKLAIVLRCGGREVRRELEVAGMPIYRGVIKSGQTGFKDGDVHTWGGSMWVCKRDTDNPPPGDDWQLGVKGAK